jgi:putative nucleotidyltransferase with HDIG domain
MAVEAAGTWQHSQVLAMLAEAAAEKIGARALMSRVVCYYHDIGKCIKPNYFIENLKGAPNPHDKLTPAMSALVILSHPKDGRELARQHHLPHEVIDAIMQHHGTTRVEYFYRRALEKVDEGEEVREEVFRYSGPKPQNREMGIIMLADSAEGAVRAMVQNSKDVNPARIRSEVEKVVRNKIEMGQLDESGLTLTEITSVIDEFTKTFLAIHHNRIEYPKSPEELREENHEKTTSESSTGPS